MVAKDNREFLAELEKTGEAIQIKQEVDWDNEAGAIVRRVCETGAPTPFMQNIKDYPGHRIVGGVLSNFRRIAIATGLDPNIHPREMINEFGKRRKNLIKPVMVKDAPCQENVAMGKDVDLTKFPFPMVHDGDGGRYITWHGVIEKDPENGFVNWGMYRMMIHNEHLLGALVLLPSDGAKISSKYHAKGEACPFAIAIGPPPTCAIASASAVGVGYFEGDVAGALQGSPVEMVKCKTVDLEVPANTEIVLEGHSMPGTLVDEGPFGEYTGFRSSPRNPREVWNVECITWRNDPIMMMSNMGMPVDEGQIIPFTLALGLLYTEALQNAGMPITGVYVPPEACGWVVIVSALKIFDSMPQHIATIIAGGTGHMGTTAKIIIIVDHETDPFDFGQVLHALGSKFHPLKGYFTMPSLGLPLAPFLSLAERSSMMGGRMVIDATWPLGWDPETEKPIKMAFSEIYTPELQKKVLDNWQNYGFK